MIVKHASLMGDNVDRYTKDIEKHTVNILKHLQVHKCNQKVFKFPHSNLSVNITAYAEGAVFNILKGEELLTINFCCFEKKYVKETLDGIVFLKDKLKDYQHFENKHFDDLSDKFIYTIPFVAENASSEDYAICGEVEFYIYNALRLARK